jgi:hypothetical protein
MWLSGGAQATAKLSSQPNTDTGYSIGRAIVWAVILAVTSPKADSATRHTLRLVFNGFWASKREISEVRDEFQMTCDRTERGLEIDEI